MSRASPAVVLLHGWGTNPSVFDALSHLLASRYEVHALALESDCDTANAPRSLDAVAASIAARAPPECFVVGWSLGAQIALAWARARPAQVVRLVLLSATPCFVRRDDWPWAMARVVFDQFHAALGGDIAGTLRRFVSLQAQGDAHATRVMRSLRSALARGPAAKPAALTEGLRILCEADLRSALETIATPALIVHGERDELVPLAAAEYLASALPNGTLAVVPGAAHASFVSCPGFVEQLILDFFDER